MTRSSLLAATLAVAFFTAPTLLHAQNLLPDQTRKIFNDNKDSIVGVTGVAKVTFAAVDSKSPMNLPENENKFETTGTIVDPSGLVVVSLNTIDPGGREFSVRGARVKVETATLKEVKIVLPDGVEVPSDVVMKDLDLDLAFLRPKADSKEAKSAKFKAVDLKKSAASEIADDTVTVWRMEEIMGRKPGVMGGQVMAIMQKPRTYIRAANVVLGCPTFAMDGKVIGIGVFRTVKEKGSVVVLLPSADVLEIAEQARAAKPIAEEPPKPADTQKADTAAEKK
jgi:hypothetical protein